MYANGGWIKRTQIPPEYAHWGSFNQLIENNNDALHDIAEKAESTHVDPRLAPETQKVSDYYASGMDEKTIEAMRTKPLDDEFKRIEAIKDRNDLLKEIAHLHGIGVGVLFGFGSGQDDKDSTHEIAQAAQGGLGMPDRDYYMGGQPLTQVAQSRTPQFTEPMDQTMVVRYHRFGSAEHTGIPDCN